ncbi:archaellin/type IV pilin N-terminal domain-containing protein [Halapricum salinum]|uniref:Flagellin n=1 Tax=Halapricum salinum TaxID=1457250 RepID=A0A4D6HC38_9EURY|nr:archaellin/type IV pilin N-terminal domain-containing protein [Halapricum salinum]QCC50612.1 flagellin [Halapricum salinum]
MFERTDDEDTDRGQVGIGTLIVFIAMVLVAAIAAGVLINTAGFLQSSAEESGEQASNQVTNRLVEVSTVGTVGDVSGDAAVTEIEITTRLAPGSNDVDLDGATMQWVTAGSSNNLVSSNIYESGDNADGVFSYETLRDDDTSISGDNTLNDPVDRAIITVSINDQNTEDINSPLEPGESATLTISTQSGGETTLTLVVPDSLSGKSSVSL